MRTVRGIVGFLSVVSVVLVGSVFGQDQQDEQIRAIRELRAENARLSQENTMLRKLVGSSVSTPPSHEWAKATGDSKNTKETKQAEESSEPTVQPKEGDKGKVSGTIEKIDSGKVTIKSRNNTTITVMPYWRGGAPNEGGGFDKETMERIGKLKVGDKVAVKWTFQEHCRIDGIMTAKELKEHNEAKKTE